MLRRAPGRPRAALAWTGAALAGSWLVPVGTHAVGADLVLPPLAWLVTASLLRSGRTVLDRLVLAGGLLLSGTVVAGLLFSVWPWGLHPVAIAGCGFTLLTVAAWLTRRGPSLPRRAGDPAVLAGTGLAALAAWWPMRGRDAAGRLSLFMHIEDFSRHLNMYDTIRLAHGYMFLNQPVALRYTVGVSFLTYPQGAHLAYAVLENFAESSTVPGSAPVWADHFVWWHLAGFVGLAVLPLSLAMWFH